MHLMMGLSSSFLKSGLGELGYRACRQRRSQALPPLRNEARMHIYIVKSQYQGGRVEDQMLAYIAWAYSDGAVLLDC